MIFKNVLLCFSIVISVSSNAQDLNRKERAEMKRIMKTLEEQDQRYRKLMTGSSNTDSLWQLQTELDSINKTKFLELINSYGYPSRKRIKGSEYSLVLVLHMTNEGDYDLLKSAFELQLKLGNMPPKEYALWYDRCHINMGQENYFGAYGNKKFCGEALKEVNERRKGIGLEPLKQSEDCE